MPIAAAWVCCRDQDHRRPLQSLFSHELPRTDSHHLGLRRGLDAVLPDGRTAARRVDEAASGRAPRGMALRDRQTGWQGRLELEAAVLGRFHLFIAVVCPHHFFEPWYDSVIPIANCSTHTGRGN